MLLKGLRKVGLESLTGSYLLGGKPGFYYAELEEEFKRSGDVRVLHQGEKPPAQPESALRS